MYIGKWPLSEKLWKNAFYDRRSHAAEHLFGEGGWNLVNELLTDCFAASDGAVAVGAWLIEAYDYGQITEISYDPSDGGLR